jgi:nitrite reductase (NO-forming)
MNKTFLFISILLLVACNQAAPPSSLPSVETDTDDISHRASDVPPPIHRTENETVVFELETKELVAELAPGVTYQYWTYNGTVPGPMLRAKEGDTVEIRLTHAAHGHDHSQGESEHSFAVSFLPLAEAQEEDHEHDSPSPAPHGHDDDTKDATMTEKDMQEHAEAGHGTHSIDLHAVIGPGGGAHIMQTTTGETKVLRFKATRPGIYVYHCASPHVPSHIANGMYGMILIEPKGGLPPVDKEFYVVQGEFYTTGAVGENGHQELSRKKLLKEEPEYFVFNGRTGALTGPHALQAKTGDKIRLFFGVGSHIGSNFHIIGGVLDRLYAQGDILSRPLQNVQTTFVPPGSAIMTEFTIDVPGTYLLVDHSLSRAIDRGAVGELIIEGKERSDLLRGIARNPDPNHTHADFAIVVRGEKLDFSDARFMAGEEGHEEHNHTHDTMHLHDAVGGVIHRHKPGQSFGDFLSSIGFTLSATCLERDTEETICNEDDATWSMYVNGEKVNVDSGYVFEDEDQILLTYGSSDADIKEQLLQLTDDSCLYSKTCPGRGEPPAENCIADPEVPCVLPLEEL